MSSRLRPSFGAAIAAVFLMGGAALADDPIRIVISRVDAGDFPTVRLVASVVDASGKPLRGLRAEDLQLREPNQPTSAKGTLATLLFPLALALLVVTSGRMSGRPLADPETPRATTY